MKVSKQPCHLADEWYDAVAGLECHGLTAQHRQKKTSDVLTIGN